VYSSFVESYVDFIIFRKVEVEKCWEKAKEHSGSCNLCGDVVGDRRKHWLDGCKKCKFCMKKGTTKIFSSRKLALMHFDHV
jgi:formylmethanofuran dehydrogenase subunit E